MRDDSVGKLSRPCGTGACRRPSLGRSLDVMERSGMSAITLAPDVPLRQETLVLPTLLEPESRARYPHAFQQGLCSTRRSNQDAIRRPCS